MSSKYIKAFDSLNSDEATKRKRTERILSSQSVEVDQITEQGSETSVAKARSPVLASEQQDYTDGGR